MLADIEVVADARDAADLTPRWCSNTSSGVGRPKTIVFSTSASRSLLYEMLPPQERAKDGFICAAQTLNGLLSRSARHAPGNWSPGPTAGASRKLRETAGKTAACATPPAASDVGWRRASRPSRRETLSLITNGNFGSISHQGRAFVALSVFYRYAGLDEENEPPARIRELVPPADGRTRARFSARRSASRI